MAKIHFEPITDLPFASPLDPIQDMVNQVKTYRTNHSKAVLDYILKDWMETYLPALKEGKVEFMTDMAKLLPDGSEFEFTYENKINLIQRATYWGIDLTYKLNSPFKNKVLWVLDVIEE